MRSRRIAIIIFTVFLLLSIVYFFVRSIASPFLTEEHLKRELAESFHRVQSKITTITDIIDIDDRHKVVLFVTDKEQYGKSFWEWDRLEAKWQQVHFSIYETPELWMIDEKDERSYRLIWHHSPEAEVKDYGFYLLKTRSYHITQRNGDVVTDVYEPQVQLEHLTALDGQTYGMMSLPEEWIRIIELHKQAITKSNSQTRNLLFNHSSRSFVFRFTALDHNHDEIPEAELMEGDRFAIGGGRAQVLSYPDGFFFE